MVSSSRIKNKKVSLIFFLVNTNILNCISVFLQPFYFVSYRFYLHAQLSVFPSLILPTVLTSYLRLENIFMSLRRKNIGTEIIKIVLKSYLCCEERSINFLLGMVWLTKSYLNMQVHEGKKH